MGFPGLAVALPVFAVLVFLVLGAELGQRFPVSSLLPVGWVTGLDRRAPRRLVLADTSNRGFFSRLAR